MKGKIHIVCVVSDRELYYSGFILHEDDYFLTVDDVKIGEIRLHKSTIKSIRPFRKEGDRK